MEHIIKVVPGEDLQGKRVVLNEHLGASADPFLEDFLRFFPRHCVISHIRRKEEYSTPHVVSFLVPDEDPEQKSRCSFASCEVLVVDGANISSASNSYTPKIPEPSQILLLINRSVRETDLNYHELYESYVGIEMRALGYAAFEYVASLVATVREKSLRIPQLLSVRDVSGPLFVLGEQE